MHLEWSAMAGIMVGALKQDISISPLITFRIIFGMLMMFSVCRFWYMGWIQELYIDPVLHFPFFGWDWIQPLPGVGMYVVFALLFVFAMGICLGFYYRISSVGFFLLFTFVELIDKTTYLNHYYFVSLVAFLLCYLPAHRYFSLDCKWRKTMTLTAVPRWMVFVLQLQLAMVYFFAGVAKINPDWLNGFPMKLWLPARADFPVLGAYFQYEWTAILFSYGGLFYDLFIPFALWIKKTRPFAYLAVIVFHILTYLLFQIGVFPWVMIFCTLIFFGPEVHDRLYPIAEADKKYFRKTSWQSALLLPFFLIQLILPFRYAMYDSHLFWKEQGYRFSWRVMLMEKAGEITFYVKDLDSGAKGIFDHQKYLTQLQETQMSTQPDMILDMAHHIERIMREDGHQNVAVFAEGYVTLNGSGTKPFTVKETNLLALEDGYKNRDWIHDWDE